MEMGGEWRRGIKRILVDVFISRLVTHLFVSVGHVLLVDFCDPERGIIRRYGI